MRKFQPNIDKAEERLRQLADRIHKEGKKLRLWASHEDPVVWAKLREAGVDFLSIDQLELVRNFLLKRVIK